MPTENNKPIMKNLNQLDDIIKTLIQKATEARENAYCPYSNFKVGSAVLCEDNTIFTGCNIENASFTVGICAERCAYSKAISERKMKFKAIAVVAYQEKYFTTPCGACRQFLSEFGNINVYIAKPAQDTVITYDLATLLPYQFETNNNKLE